MPYEAKHRFARMSAKKIRPVADVVRGLPVDLALESLRYMPQRGAKLLAKVLRSAQANAEEQGVRHPEQLLVRQVRIDDGPSFKRLRPRCRGMAHVIIRRMSHIWVKLEEPEAI